MGPCHIFLLSGKFVLAHLGMGGLALAPGKAIATEQRGINRSFFD
jgi:hypothetical protein